MEDLSTPHHSSANAFTIFRNFIDSKERQQKAYHRGRSASNIRRQREPVKYWVERKRRGEAGCRHFHPPEYSLPPICGHQLGRRTKKICLKGQSYNVEVISTRFIHPFLTKD